MAIDPNQLLELCHQIKESLDKLDKSIRLTRLRMTTLSYVGDEVNCTLSPAEGLDDLNELCQLSQSLVKQLDELQSKLNDDPLNLISYQIASQQLAYFTSEWYDNLTLKFQETLELAERFHFMSPREHLRDVVGGPTMMKGTKKWTKRVERQHQLMNSSAAEMRVRNALMRLRQSMSENEQLIASISNNLAYTKMTIEAIYSSLRTTKVNLEQGEQNALESIGLVRRSERTKIILMLVCVSLVALGVLVIFRFIGLI